MAIIQIQTPSEKNDEWLQCQVINLALNHNNNSATVTLKGVSKYSNVTTSIFINDLKKLQKGEVVNSLHKYFKIKLAEDEISKNIFNIGK